MAGEAQLVVDRRAAIDDRLFAALKRTTTAAAAPGIAGAISIVVATSCTPRAWLPSIVVLIAAAASGTFQRFSVSIA